MSAGSKRFPAWLAVLFVTLLATGTDEFVIAGVLPTIADDLDVSVSAAGQLVTVFAVVYALGAPLLALITERMPRRGVVSAGLLVFVVANAAAALAAGYWMLMAARVVAALGAAVVTSAAFATASDGAPEGRQGRYLAVTVSGITVALFTGVPVGTWLAGTFGWRTTFWFVAALGMVAALGTWATLPKLAGTPGLSLAQRLAPLRNRTVGRALGVTMLGATGGLMFYSYLAPFATATANSSSGLLVTLLFVIGVLGVGGAWFGGRGTDRLGAHRALWVVMAGHAGTLAAIALLAAGGLLAPWALTLSVAAWSVFAWAFNPPLQGVLLATAPRSSTTVLALNISAMYLGIGAGGALGGVIVDALGARWVPAISAVLLCVAFGLVPGRPRDRTAGEYNPSATV